MSVFERWHQTSGFRGSCKKLYLVSNAVPNCQIHRSDARRAFREPIL
jgi:hypothetical protein